MQSEKYDVVVVGSGLGGVGAAALLSHWGYKTLVVEKLNRLGGRWSNYEYEGFWLPTGALALLYHGTEIEEIYNEVKAETEFVRVPKVSYRIGGKDWEMPAKGAIGAMLDIVEKIAQEKGQKEGPTGTFSAEKVTNAFHEGIQNRANLGLVTLKDYFLRHTDNEMAIGIFETISNTICGAHSYEIQAAAFFSFLVASRGFRDVSIAPKGNLANIESLVEVVRANGDVWTNSPAKRIVVEGGRAKAVVVEKDGQEIEVASQVVISNAGPKATVGLAGAQNFDEGYLADVRVKLRPHPVTICLIASDRPIWPEDGSPAYLMIVGARRISSVVPLSNISPNFAPPGQYLTFCFCGPVSNEVRMNPEEEEEQILLDLKEQFPLFEKHGRVLKLDPRNIDDDLPEMRARCGEGVPFSTPIKDLYNVGDGCNVYGYSGSNLAAGSAKPVAETIRNSIKPEKA
jgi:phytoene dehydrogenase-like protein